LEKKRKKNNVSFLKKYEHYLLLHLIVFLFGFTGILGKLISIDAATLVWYRVLIASITIFLFLKWKKKSLLMTRDGLLKSIGTGLIIAAHWLCFFESIKQANVSIALICLSSATFFTSLIEPLFHKRKVKTYEVLFGLIVIGGLCFIFNIESRFHTGIIYGVASAFLASLFSVINSILIKQDPAETISFWELSSGFVGLTFYLFFFQDFNSVQLKMEDFVYLLILGIVCTAYAFVISIEVMKSLTPYTVNISINLEPVYGIILALVIFGDSEFMSPGFYIGGLIILLTIFGNALMKKREKLK